MKRVLIIAYYFPPIGGSGVQRPTKFVKYLPQFGWQPYIIATDRPPGEEGWDETLLADVPPSAQVWRVPTPQPQPVNRLARWVGWQAATARRNGKEAVAPDSGALSLSHLSLGKRLRRALLAPLYLMQEPPVDQALYWSLRVVPLARRIIKQEKIDVVLTSVPPWSPLLTGAGLQKVTGCPWIADFRDPWTDNRLIYLPSWTRRQFDEWLERRLLARVDAVVSVTEPCLRGLREKAMGKGQDKPFFLIPNGWDRGDFPEGDIGRPGEPPGVGMNQQVVLLHPGSIYKDGPLPILRALELLQMGKGVLEHLRFKFVGYMHPEDQARIVNSPWHSLFEVETQRVSHPIALQLMRDSGVLLLLLHKQPEASSGKIYEYMVAGRPVLSVGSGVASDLVQRCGIGCVVHPDAVERLAQLLRQIVVDYGGFVREYYHPDWDVINQYERRVLTGKLAAALDQVQESAKGR